MTEFFITYTDESGERVTEPATGWTPPWRGLGDIAEEYLDQLAEEGEQDQ